jgi:hypothetical protein
MATSDGTWTHETKQNGIVVSTVTGRDPRATIKKLSSIWWVYNSDDPIPPLESGPPMTLGNMRELGMCGEPCVEPTSNSRALEASPRGLQV